MQTAPYRAARVWKLPPLILHPFSDSGSPQKLVQSSRASLMLQGLLPRETYSLEQLQAILLDGRYCEVRMLFYLGKDLVRWIDQCTETVCSQNDVQGAGIEWQSFAQMLIEDSPPAVREKLRVWGVADYKSIFARAIGLNSVFAEVPERSTLSEDFIRNYHLFADRLFTCKQAQKQFTPVLSEDFPFELFASGEYSRMLEKQWQEQ
jgi:hypothetical protein